MTSQIPPPPEKPTPFECCGSGCIPCIFDYYELRLIAWEEKYGITLADYHADSINHDSSALDTVFDNDKSATATES